MTDSVDVIESSRNAAAIESAIQNWLDTTTFTSVDDVETHRRGSNKTLVIITYTA